MWSFLRTRDRFSLDELRYLTEQLKRVQSVNEVNKDVVIESLRSIAEVVTYGDQNDPTFFDFFMEKQVMGEFVRILKISRTGSVALQLLQTMSIMIQNLKSEHAIYYIFSNEYINYLITYSFDFKNEELLSYYISFLRAISGKLDKNTISLLVKTRSDEVVSFPLYIEAIRYAFHGENMVRIAVRALTLNVYHVGDESVNRYVTSTHVAHYFSDLITYFRKLCIQLDGLVSAAAKSSDSESISSIRSAVYELEDYLYYISDAISAGVPNLGTLITDNILKLLFFPLLLPSLAIEVTNGSKIGATTALYLLCSILRIVKIKDLSNSIAAALFCGPKDLATIIDAIPNGISSDRIFPYDDRLDGDACGSKTQNGSLRIIVPDLSSLQINPVEDSSSQHCDDDPHLAFREVFLSYIVHGEDIQVLGSLNVLATLLQTKELDESMLDAIGILPQRKQHKKLLLQALVGEGPDEEQLFSSGSYTLKDGTGCALDVYLKNLKDQYGLSCSCREVGVSPRVHRFQVLDALVSLFCRSNISAESLLEGCWLSRQLLPYSDTEFNSHHLESIRVAYKSSTHTLLQEVRGMWPDLVVTVLISEWKKCKKAIEASSPQKDPKWILLQQQKHLSDGEDSSLFAGKRMCEVVKIFVLYHQLQIFSQGGALPDYPSLSSPTDISSSSRAAIAGLNDILSPKDGTEINIVGGIPCRISFERGKERHFFFLAVCNGISGWLLLADQLPLKQNRGIVRVSAPLAGSSPRIDEKHAKWLHLRIRPSTLPFVDPERFSDKSKAKSLIDGRWTLAFRDEESAQSACLMIQEEMDLLCNEVERRLNPLLVEFNTSTQEESVHSL
ncbi:hypothetical protein ACHQM5_030497 [Ranunculus cassubicifolius]